MASERVAVATSGTVNRIDNCPACGARMVYRLEEGMVMAMFCGNVIGCEIALQEAVLARK